MKRLVRGENRDPYLGNPVEISYTKSKYYGFRGWVDGNYVKDKNTTYKYKIFLNPAPYENTTKPHVVYVDYDKMYKWVRVIPIEALQGN